MECTAALSHTPDPSVPRKACTRFGTYTSPFPERSSPHSTGSAPQDHLHLRYLWYTFGTQREAEVLPANFLEIQTSHPTLDPCDQNPPSNKTPGDSKVEDGWNSPREGGGELEWKPHAAGFPSWLCPFVSWANLGKFSDLSEPQFP